MSREGEGSTDSYRRELRAWLSDHLTDRYRGLDFSGEPSAEWLSAMGEWNRALADAGYAAPGWPRRWGGRDASLLELVAHEEEMARAGAPGPLNAIGVPNIAPAIMAFGTEAQCERFLAPLLSGEEIWCQGFSEPDAGSDLASLGCRAVREGDHYVVSGQKVWTTLAQVADRCELLVRTDPDASRPHRGITALLVDMATEGVSVRPLRTITGSAEFTELFFDGALIPVSDRLGEENEGWMVAMSTLANERGGVAKLHLQLRERIEELVGASRSAARSSDPLVRQTLARLWSEGELLRLLAQRAIGRAASGEPPGAESSAVKLAWAQLGQRTADAALDILAPGSLEGHWAENLLYSRSMTIAGGTTEVNKNLIAERVLGLPRG